MKKVQYLVCVLVGTVGKFSIKTHSDGGREAGVCGSSLDGKRSRDPGVCVREEVPVSCATCAAALRAHTADLMFQLFIANANGTFFGMSESLEASTRR